LKTILLGVLAAIVFVQLSTLAQEYLLAFATVRLDTVVLDFLSRKLLSLPMTYFTSRRTGDIQRRLDGARQVRQFAVQQGVGALLAAVFLVGALILMAMYSPLLTIAFLSVSQKLFKATFIVMSYDSVLQSIGLFSTAIFLWVGATQVIHGHLSVGGFVAFSSLTAMAYAGILRALGVWDSMQQAVVLL